jgi:hypothetical protein
MVLGQRILGDEERLRTQRTWLLGKTSGRAALCLSFSAAPTQPFDISLVPGTTIDAELVFFRSAFPLRALVKSRSGNPSTPEPVFQHKNISDAIAFSAAAFSANPWIERIPFALSSVVPRADNSWRIVDSEGNFLKLDVNEEIAWRLISISGGHPIALAGEWDGACLYPVSAWAEGRFYRCDR